MDTELFDLTFTQRDIYLAQARQPMNPMYNIGGYIRFSAIDVERLQKAHRYMVNNHDVFGIRIKVTEEGVFQYIEQHRDTKLPVVDFSHHNDSVEVADHWLNEKFTTYIDINVSDLFRSFILKLSENSYRYVSLAHHIVVDGWGFANLARLLGRYYNNGQSDAETEMSWYSVAQRDADYRQSKKYNSDQNFWQEYLALQSFEKMIMPYYQRHYSELDAVPSGREIYPLAVDKVVALKKMAGEIGIGFAQVMMAMTSIYFSRSYGRESLVLGLPVHNRSGHLQKNMIGVFTSISPLVVSVNHTFNFATFIRSLSANQKKCFRHQRYPIGDIYQCLNHSPSQTPLFDVAFNYLHLDSFLKVEGHSADLVYLSHCHEQTPVMLNVWEYGRENNVEIQLDYNLANFSATDARRMVQGIVYVIDQVLQNPNLLISDIQFIAAEEKLQLQQLATANVVDNGFDGLSIHVLFENQVEAHSDQVAVYSQTGQLTYEQLNQKANKFAAYLLASGVTKEIPVGVCLSRNEWLPVALLGILKAGCAYVPLDQTLPDEKLDYIVQDSGITLVVVDEAINKVLPKGCQLVVISQLGLEHYSTQNSLINIAPERLAYVIYTSGSTGKPKGVEVCHGNAVAMLQWAANHFPIEQSRCVLASTSLSFDLSVFEIFHPLSIGSSCFVVENVLALSTFTPRITLINTVPSAMKVLIENNAVPATVIAVNLAGEALSQELVNQLFEAKACQVVRNLYGPSEDTTYSTVMTFYEPIDYLPPIGYLVDGSFAAILNEQQQLMSVGAVGELYLGGAGVSRGYRNAVELTLQKYVELSLFGDSMKRWYRTGDMVRVDNDGILHFMGRVDEQLKINGFRIEPGEIEAVMSRHQAISDVIVVAKTSASRQVLVAYWVGKSHLTTSELRDWLEGKLSYYMIPDYFVLLDVLPLNSNGKVDKKQLPEPVTNQILTIDESFSITEQKLLNMWQLLLGATAISRNSNFFDIGGSSIVVMQLLARINIAFSVKIALADIFINRTIAAQAVLVERSVKTSVVDTITVSGETQAPLSFTQQRLWFVEQLSNQNNPYNMVSAFKLDGEVNIKHLADSLNMLLERHPVLTTTYHQIADDVIQRVNHERQLELSVSQMSSIAVEQELETFYKAQLAESFDLTHSLMLRVCLLQHSVSTAYLFIATHHIAMDGLSIGLIFKDLSQIYAAKINNIIPEPVTTSVQYIDFSLWQSEQPQDNKAKSISFWQEHLKGAPLEHNLPLDFTRKTDVANVGQRLFTCIDSSLCKQVQSLADRLQVTPFCLLKSTFALLLCRFSATSDIVIGVPVAGRNQPHLDSLVGAFINTLPLRIKLDEQSRVGDWLQQCQQILLQSLSHQDLSFDELVNHLDLPYNSGYTPVFQVLINYMDKKITSLELADLEVHEVETTAAVVKFDMEVHIYQDKDQWGIEWLYNASLFKPQTINQLIDSFQYLLRAICDAPDTRLADIGLTDLKAQAQITDWNLSGHNAVVAQADILDLFAQQAVISGDNVALTSIKNTLTYKGLDQRVNDIYLYLLATCVGQQSKIGLMLNRGSDIQASMLAILRIGAVFVPMVATMPTKRLEYIAQDSQIDFLLTDTPNPIGFEGDYQRLFLSSVSAQTAIGQWSKPADDLIAYILYTSGSTGKPKGVQISRKALSNVIVSMLARLDFQGHQHWLGLTPMAFDISLFEGLAPLSRGDSSYLLNDEQSDNPALMVEVIKAQAISVIQTTPARWRLLLDFGWQGHDKFTGVSGGEAMTLDLQRQLSQRCGRIFNGYGPTEAAIWTCVNQIDATTDEVKRLSIGRSLANYTHVVITEHNQLLPMGSVGELAIAGDSVSPGYVNQPELNGSRFFIASFSPYQGQRFYKTGDVVRLNGDGDLVYLGRCDDQLKIRGALVEPTEVQMALLNITGVEQVYVCGFGEKEAQQLVAYLVLESSGKRDTISPETLRHQLGRTLPTYMIPTQFEYLDALPLNISGKVDRNALPLPVASASTQIVLARGETQIRLVQLWADRLNTQSQQICVELDFFSLGGHSLLSTRLLKDIGNHYQDIELSLADFLTDSRISAIANRIDDQLLARALTQATMKKQSIIL